VWPPEPNSGKNFAPLDFHVATIGDRHGALERIPNFAEDLRHFFRRLEEELVGGEFHPACRSSSFRFDASRTGRARRVAEIMAVVRGDQ
jgi:hypothetical protein